MHGVVGKLALVLVAALEEDQAFAVLDAGAVLARVRVAGAAVLALPLLQVALRASGGARHGTKPTTNGPMYLPPSGNASVPRPMRSNVPVNLVPSAAVKEPGNV